MSYATVVGPCILMAAERQPLTGENTGVVLSSENTPFQRPSQWAGAKATRIVSLRERRTALAESKTSPAGAGCGRVSHGNRETSGGVCCDVKQS